MKKRTSRRGNAHAIAHAIAVAFFARTVRSQNRCLNTLHTLCP